MKISLSRTLSTKSSLIVISCLIGYSFWSIIRHSQIGRLRITVPLYIYNISDSIKVSAPSTVTLQLMGPRSSLATVDRTVMAAFINRESLNLGENIVKIKRTNLLLPTNIELAENSCSTVVIQLASNNSQDLIKTDE